MLASNFLLAFHPARFARKQNAMEIYDIIMLVVLVGATLFGAIKGFAWQVASIASFVVSYMVAYHFREPFSESIHAAPPWNRFLAMLILFVGTSLVIWMAFRMISGTIDRLRLNEFDRQIGALFGFGKGVLYCSVITFFAVTILGENARDKIVSSKSGNYIAKILDRSQAIIPPELHEIVQPHLDKFDQRFNSDQPVERMFPNFASGLNELGGSLPTSASNTEPNSFWDDSATATPFSDSAQPFGQPGQPSFGQSTQPQWPQQAQQPSVPDQNPTPWPPQF